MGRNNKLTTIKTRLNQIVDEFSPGQTPGTASEYLQLMDCSVALYEAIQKYTTCSSSAVDASNPFCTEYGKEQPYRSGIYYFLDYTMEEVPFAWWHKCMLLQGRTFGKVLTFVFCYTSIALSKLVKISAGQDVWKGTGIVCFYIFVSCGISEILTKKIRNFPPPRHPPTKRAGSSSATSGGSAPSPSRTC